MLQRLSANSSDFNTKLAALRRLLSPDGSIVSERGKQLTIELFGEPLSPQQVVERICTEVREQGTKSVTRFSRILDKYEAYSESVRVPTSKLEEAHSRAHPQFLSTVRRIRENIAHFQTAILHRDVSLCPSVGVRLEQRYRPLHRVGICVPGGAAAYPSTVLMTAVPALCAGVEELAIVSPPTANGAFNPDVLAVCYELGIEEVYAIGGAQGVASLAYGIPEIPAVDMIVGPGNLFVALAKRFVYGTVNIDSIAGPSEVIVIADNTTSPANAASDLLAQAEHSPGSSIVISDSLSMLDQIDIAIASQLKGLDRSDLIRSSLNEYGASIHCSDEVQVSDIVNRLAPEHLQISVDHPDRFLERIQNVGAAFLGHYSPVALGDYAAGPSHVLPTGGTARWASGLTSNSFLRSHSVVEYDRAALESLREDINLIAKKEGLTAHRESVEIRFKN